MRITLVVAILLLLCGVGVCAESQPASSRAEKQKPEVNKTYSTSHQDKKTEVIVVPIQPTANNSQNGTNTQPPEDKNLIVNQKIAKYTGYLALLAFLQFIAMAIQAAFLSKTLDATKEAANAAQQAAEAAELNARAAIGIELPVIRAITTDMVYTSKLIGDTEPYGGIVNDGPPTQYSAVGCIRFENHGRTPAFPDKLVVGWKVTDKLPEIPHYTTTSNLNHAEVIKAGDSFISDTHYGIELTDDEIKQTSENQAWLWFYGCLFYTDFMNTRREARFCWRFANRNHGKAFYYFSSDGEPPKAYTQNT